jgi:hypothetical protein
MCEMCQNHLSDPYPFSGGRIARIRGGQQPPAKGNFVMAYAVVLLPRAVNSSCLKPELVFADRLEVMAGWLTAKWGYQIQTYRETDPHMCQFLLSSITNEEYRLAYTLHSEPTWREAMSAAWEYAHNELMKLEDALAARQRALEEAECPQLQQLQHTVARKITIG